jgi:hypothetical protein
LLLRQVKQSNISDNDKASNSDTYLHESKQVSKQVSHALDNRGWTCCHFLYEVMDCEKLNQDAVLVQASGCNEKYAAKSIVGDDHRTSGSNILVLIN